MAIITPQKFVSDLRESLREYGPDSLGDTANYTYTVKGQMFVASYEVDRLKDLTDDDIKRHVCMKLAQELYQANSFVEYTKVVDPNTFKEIVRARIFILNNSDTKVLRLNKINQI